MNCTMFTSMKIFYTIVALLLCTTGLLAQTIVNGQITDAVSQEGLPGVTVVEKGTTNGAVTDLDGKYQLSVSSGDATLLFSYVGYVAQEIDLANQTQLDVALAISTTALSEVVVTALGLERDSRDLGYAVQRLDGQDIADVKSPNFVDNLAGQVAGVTISQGATGVGSTSKITIRGEASFTNNNPLFVLDGVPINNNSILNFTNEAAAGFQEVDFGNGAMEINADDVASVTVLKGPSAAALYGTRASNGVIIVTTKDGSESTGLGISFNSSTFVESAFQLPEFQNSYGQGNSGQIEFVDGLGGGTNDNITYSWGPRLDAGN